MINVVFARGPDYVGLEVTGHANAAPHGEDLVCAAVSVLAQTFVAALVTAGFEPEYLMETGDVICIFRFKRGAPMAWEFIDNAPDQDAVINSIVHTIQTGMMYLAESYPQYIKVFQE